ncbi:MAG: AIM24 family protein [Bacilli bacterium]
MYKVNNFFNNNDVNKVDEKGAFSIAEYKRDLSVDHSTAVSEYFASKMNIHRRQLVCDLSKSDVTVQAGTMQWMIGDASATTGVKGVGDFLKKSVGSKVTGESTIKPEYVGDGMVVLEPTYKHILLEDLADWNGSVVLDDGLFLACHNTAKFKVISRTNLSSAVLGNEGLFNLSITGDGIVALESNCPREELIEIYLEEDVVKIDGNMAIAWSSSLKFTVERSGKTLVGSATSKEGLVNVYRGTGKILMAPVAR